jgi:hypothetical protein
MEQEIILNFGGFYDSIHSDIIDSQIELYGSDDNGDYNWEDDLTNYQKTNKNYAKAYIEIIKKYLFENNVKVDMDFIEIDSPAYYNFATDLIIIKILSREHQKKIIKFVKSKFKNELAEYIKDTTTTRDGYMSFYTQKEVLKNKDNKLIEACLKMISNFINRDFQDLLEIEFDIEN